MGMMEEMMDAMMGKLSKEEKLEMICSAGFHWRRSVLLSSVDSRLER